MLLQEIKFKNDINENPRSILLKYDISEKGKYAYPAEIIEVGPESFISYYKDGDVILPTIYNYLSYSKTLKGLK